MSLPLKIFKRELVQELRKNVATNLERYSKDGFESVILEKRVKDLIVEVKGVQIDEAVFSKLNTVPGGQNDAENSVAIYNSIKGLRPHQAADERVWVALTHTLGREFTQSRWVKSESKSTKQTKDIQAHYFASGERGLRRNNSLASLWWWAHLIDQANIEVNFENVLRLIKYTDFRASIVERPGSARCPKVFRAIFEAKIIKELDDPETSFFTRKNIGSGNYLDWLKMINRNGGIYFYSHASVSSLTQLFSSFIDEIENQGPKVPT